jgi:hypothetical protein
MKRILLLAAISAVLIGLSACSGYRLPSLSGDEAREALASSKTVYVTGNRSRIHFSSDVDVGDAIAGRIKEKGIINSRFVYSIDGEKQFYVASPWVDRPPYDNPNGGETVAYFDMDKNCIGYLQEIYQSENWAGGYLFFDAESNPKNYYIPRDGWSLHGAVICDMDGNEAGRIEVRRSGREWYSIHMSLDDGAAAELSELDRIGMLYETELLVTTAMRSAFYGIESDSSSVTDFLMDF